MKLVGDSITITNADVNVYNSPSIFDGTQQVTVAAALNGGTTQACIGVTVQADPENTDYVFVGNSGSQSIKLEKGSFHTISVSNVNKVYVKANSGTQRVNWHAQE